jgi:hypothetical protein
MTVKNCATRTSNGFGNPRRGERRKEHFEVIILILRGRNLGGEYCPAVVFQDTDQIDRTGYVWDAMLFNIPDMVARQEGLLPPARLQNWT